MANRQFSGNCPGYFDYPCFQEYLDAIRDADPPSFGVRSLEDIRSSRTTPSSPSRFGVKSLRGPRVSDGEFPRQFGLPVKRQDQVCDGASRASRFGLTLRSKPSSRRTTRSRPSSQRNRQVKASGFSGRNDPIIGEGRVETRLDMDLNKVIILEGLRIDPAIIAADESGVDDCYLTFIPVRTQYQIDAINMQLDNELARYRLMDPRNYPGMKSVVAEYPL